MQKSMTPSLYFAAAILMIGTIILSSCSKDNDTTAAAVTISGASTSGRSFQYAGTVVFTGNKTATFTLGSGVTYNIQW